MTNALERRVCMCVCHLSITGLYGLDQNCFLGVDLRGTWLCELLRAGLCNIHNHHYIKPHDVIY